MKRGHITSSFSNLIKKIRKKALWFGENKVASGLRRIEKEHFKFDIVFSRYQRKKQSIISVYDDKKLPLLKVSDEKQLPESLIPETEPFWLSNL